MWSCESGIGRQSHIQTRISQFKRRGRTMKRLACLALAVLWVTPAAAQLVEPNQLGVRMGHVHLTVQDVEAQKNFWISIMGGTLVKNGPLELIQFPGVFIMLR